MVEIVFIGLGSNLGDREKMIRGALGKISDLPGTRLDGTSRLMQTQPVGPVKKQPMFLNAAARVSTLLGPLELLDGLLGIERSLGRVRRERWGPRTIDLDILMYGSRRIDHPRLRVPHPELWNRPFILEALRELHAF